MNAPFHRFSQPIRLARRELRSGLRGFGVFLACLFLGVFAISAIGSFTASAESGLMADAGALLGGDLELRRAHRPIEQQEQAYLESLGRTSHVMTMRSMAFNPASETRLLVELKAVDQHYPLYGELTIDPQGSLDDMFGQENAFGALVEDAFLARSGTSVGDTIRIGTGDFTIRGVLTREPDRTIRAFTLGPRIMVSRSGLDSTGLLQPGSLVNHAYRLRLPDREQAENVKTRIQERFPDAGWRIRTWREAAPRVRFFLERMGLNMTLIGLCALLVGGLGVYGAVRGYLNAKIVHIASMKCLGAPGHVLFSAYLLQVLFLGLIGSTAGLACGAALPYLLSWTIGDRLPIPLAPSIHIDVLATAAGFGLLIALIFSLKALGIACRVSPSVLFRGYHNTFGQDPGRRTWFAIGGSVLALGALILVTSSDQRMALWFIVGATACFGLFRAAAQTIIRVTRKLPRPAAPSLRLGLGNIHRTGSPAASALFSLGLGLTALVIIVLVQANLDDMVSETVPNEAPAFFFLDLQPHQVQDFEKVISAHPGVTRSERYPTLRGRITAIDGTPVEEAIIAPEVRWAVRGDRFLSYASEAPPEAIFTAGEWWPEDYLGPPRISLTADVAKGFGVTVGDSLSVNILGREVTAEITNLREVDWSTLDLNFAIIFAPGTLESAPQTHIAALHTVPGGEDSVYQVITGAFPNVSAISTREVLKNVSRTLERIGTAFRSMAAIALLTGFLVLAGAVSADQHRRLSDAVIFKVCGATRLDILKAFATEFLLLGAIAGLLSAVIGSVAAFGILEGLMKTSFSLHTGAVVTTILIGIIVTLTLGLAGTWKALGQKPASYLRED